MLVTCWKNPLAILGNLLGTDVHDILFVLSDLLGKFSVDLDI